LKKYRKFLIKTFSNNTWPPKCPKFAARWVLEKLHNVRHKNFVIMQKIFLFDFVKKSTYIIIALSLSRLLILFFSSASNKYTALISSLTKIDGSVVAIGSHLGQHSSPLQQISLFKSQLWLKHGIKMLKLKNRKKHSLVQNFVYIC